MQITDILAQMGGLQSMARELGVSEDEAASGAAALAPAILGGFKKQAQAQPAGANGLGDLLERLGGGGLLDQVLAPQPTDVSPGNDVLGQIFGSKDVSRAVAQNAASQSGLAPGLLQKMLPMLAMLISGYMARQHSGGAASNRRWRGPGRSARRPAGRAGRWCGCCTRGRGIARADSAGSVRCSMRTATATRSTTSSGWPARRCADRRLSLPRIATARSARDLDPPKERRSVRRDAANRYSTEMAFAVGVASKISFEGQIGHVTPSAAARSDRRCRRRRRCCPSLLATAPGGPAGWPSSWRRSRTATGRMCRR